MKKNYDEIFKTLDHDKKIYILSKVSSRVNEKFKALYPDSTLDKIWGYLPEESKKVGIEMYLNNC